jgi:hypothetical protein
MSQPPVNPYAPGYSPLAPSAAPDRPASQYVHPPTGLQYLYLYNFVFENPKWLATLLWGVLCQFIPVIGVIVLQGYQMDTVEQLHLRPRQVYPEFDINRFVDYLKRGVWPFLISLIYSFLLMPIIMVLFYGPLFIRVIAAAADEQMAGVTAAVIIPLSILLVFAAMLLAPMLLVPMFLRAGLMQELPGALSFRFIKDFIRRVWLEVLLGQVFLLITYPIVFGVGAALCCVGIYPAVVVWFLANTHLMLQLYELYLIRGGEKIPLASGVPPVRPTTTSEPVG